MGGTRLKWLKSWAGGFGWLARGGPAEFGWVARGFGAGGAWSLDAWHAALIGAGGSGVWMGGTRLRSWRPAEFGWVARGSGAGGPRFWMVGTRLGAGGPRHAALSGLDAEKLLILFWGFLIVLIV